VLSIPGAHIVECPQRPGVHEYLAASGLVVPVHPHYAEGR